MDSNRLFALLDKLDLKLDRLEQRLDGIDVHLAKYNLELEHHIARTEQIELELLPLVQQGQQIKGMQKLIAWLVGAASVVASLYEFLKRS